MLGTEMRTMIIVSVAALAACAGQPSNPPAHYAPEATTAALAAAGAAPSDPLAERLAAAKKLGYTVVNTDGELLYCRSDLKTGSHVQKETTCLTAAQLDHLHDQSRLDLQNYLKPNMPPK
jgi:hypothetical protein